MKRLPSSTVKSSTLALIRLYQRHVSAGLPPACRFQPTCSHYGYEAIERYGALRGTLMAAWRILRCNPWNDGGIDPVASNLPTQIVSRETISDHNEALVASGPVKGRGRWLGAFGLLAFVALVAACGSPPGPRGWAGARPVTVDNADVAALCPQQRGASVAGPALVLVAHKKTLYAVCHDGSQPWQFPPSSAEKKVYPLSKNALEDIRLDINALSADDAVKEDLQTKAAALTVEGTSEGVLKEAIEATGLSDDATVDLRRNIENAIEGEKRALKEVKGFYGDIALSEDGATAYVSGFGGWLYAVDLTSEDGQLVWAVDTGKGIVGGVAVDGDRLYVGTRDEKAYELDAATGFPNWTFRASDEIWATPALDDDGVYISSLDGSLYKLNRAGEKQWDFDAGSGIAARPVLADGTVYIGAFNSKVYAINASDGKMKWSADADNWFWAAAVVDDDTVYVASLDGRVYGLNVDDGTEKWDFDVESPIRSTPVMAGDSLVVAGRNGRVFKVDLDSGQAMGEPLSLDADKVEANLATDGEDTVYLVPRDDVLVIIDAAAQLKSQNIPLN